MNNVQQKKHSNTVLPAVFLANMMSAPATWAVDVNVGGEIAPGIMRYTYQEDFIESDDVKWQDNVPFLEAGAGAALSFPWEFSWGSEFIKTIELFGDIHGQWADTGDDREFRDTLPVASDKSIDFKRRDLVVTLPGVKIITGGILVIEFPKLGYKGGKTEINGTHRRYPLNSVPSIQAEDSTTLENNGWFLGGAVALRYGSFAATVNVSYSWLDSKYDSNLNTIHEDGDDEALTYGLKLRYTSPNYPRVSLTLSADYYSYETRLHDTGTQRAKVSSVEERIIPVKLSISYRF